MKKKLLLIIYICSGLIGQIFSQPANNWSEPFAITDSLSYNSSPNLLRGSGELFYEKKFDSLSHSSIYYQYIGGEEIAVLSNDSINYRNPLPIEVDYNYFLLYESDQNGNYDIYALEYFGIGSFGDTIQLTSAQYDENSLRVSYNSWGSHFATWIANGNVYVANISDYSGDLSFENITIVDTGQCSNPVCAYNIVYWQRFENNESHIFKAEYNNNNWSAPQAVYVNGDNVDLSMTRVLWDEFDEPSVIWENSGQIMYYNTYNEEVDTIGLNGIDSAFQASSFCSW